MSQLDPILESTRERLENLRHRMLADLERDAFAQEPPLDFVGAIREPGISLIAEIKRRSPSAGEIHGEADPARIAAAYKEGGARALSVLTEPNYFGGSLDDLKAAKHAARLPVLRKDFTLHHFQVVESRAEGADAVLLIVAAIQDVNLLSDLAAAARDLEMATLIEVHREDELEKALSIDPLLIGINQRDLKTLEVHPGLAARLRGQIPREVSVVAESGISTRSDVEELEAANVDAILIGESLMRSSDPARSVRELLGSV